MIKLFKKRQVVISENEEERDGLGEKHTDLSVLQVFYILRWLGNFPEVFYDDYSYFTKMILAFFCVHYTYIIHMKKSKLLTSYSYWSREDTGTSFVKRTRGLRFSLWFFPNGDCFLQCPWLSCVA